MWEKPITSNKVNVNNYFFQLLPLPPQFKTTRSFHHFTHGRKRGHWAQLTIYHRREFMFNQWGEKWPTERSLLGQTMSNELIQTTSQEIWWITFASLSLAPSLRYAVCAKESLNSFKSFSYWCASRRLYLMKNCLNPSTIHRGMEVKVILESPNILIRIFQFSIACDPVRDGSCLSKLHRPASLHTKNIVIVREFDLRLQWSTNGRDKEKEMLQMFKNCSHYSFFVRERRGRAVHVAYTSTTIKNIRTMIHKSWKP